MANAVVRRCLLSIGLIGALCAPVAWAAGDSFVVPGSQAANERSCVEATDFMRRNHMEVIQHQRDETVHGGIRATRHSLAGCISCHVRHEADGTPVPVNQPEQFCGACHAYLAVHLNCFDCHAKVPSPSARAGLPEISDPVAGPPPSEGSRLAAREAQAAVVEGGDTP